MGKKGERDNVTRGAAGFGVDSAAAARAAIASAQDELERMPAAASQLGALICRPVMDVCDSELPELPGDDDETAWVMKCDGNGTGIDVIWLGEVTTYSRVAARENLSGNVRAFCSISMLAFP